MNKKEKERKKKKERKRKKEKKKKKKKERKKNLAINSVVHERPSLRNITLGSNPVKEKK